MLGKGIENQLRGMMDEGKRNENNWNNTFFIHSQKYLQVFVLHNL